MRSRPLVLALVLVTAALAGCTGGSEDAETASTALNETATNETNETETTPEDTGPQINRTWHNATVQGSNIPGIGEYCFPGCDGENTFTVQVANGTQGLLLEAFWNGSAQMRLEVNQPGDDCETNTANEDCAPEDATGSSPLSVQPPQVPGGEWSVEIWPRDSPTQSVEVTVVVSAFADQPVPSTYSKAPGR